MRSIPLLKRLTVLFVLGAAASPLVQVPAVQALRPGLKVAKGKTPKIRVSCPTAGGAACRLKIALATAGKKPKALAQAQSLTLQPGASASRTLRLTRAAKSTLRRKGKLSGVITVTRSGIPSGNAVSTAKVQLRA